ncbi:MAG: hypothetical protein GX303_02560 [Clostridiales bacterium]|nr:hypothetical protein [Clostridiales bacterium]
MEYFIDNTDIYCKRQINLINDFRKLWMDELIWGHSLISSIIDGSGDVSYVVRRLFRMPEEFAELFRKFYGVENAATIESLVRQHLLITATIVNDQGTLNEEAYNADRERWFENADNIAMFLSQINPFWNVDIWKQLLHEYIELLETVITSRFNEKYDIEIETFDILHEHVMKMSDYIVEGIKRQYNI